MGRDLQDEFLCLAVLIELAVFYSGQTNPEFEKQAFRLQKLYWCFHTPSGICAVVTKCSGNVCMTRIAAIAGVIKCGVYKDNPPFFRKVNSTGIDNIA